MLTHESSLMSESAEACTRINQQRSGLLYKSLVWRQWQAAIEAASYQGCGMACCDWNEEIPSRDSSAGRSSLAACPSAYHGFTEREPYTNTWTGWYGHIWSTSARWFCLWLEDAISDLMPHLRWFPENNNALHWERLWSLMQSYGTLCLQPCESCCWLMQRLPATCR